jgi:hypothetical protein
LVGICVSRSGETELKFQLPPRRQDSYFIDPKGHLEMQPWLDRFQKLAKAKNDPFRFSLHRVARCPYQNYHKHDDDNTRDQSPGETRQMKIVNDGRLAVHAGPRGRTSTERKQVNCIGKMKVAVSDSSSNASVIQSSVLAAQHSIQNPFSAAATVNL